VSTLLPPLFEGLVDDASMFPPGNASPVDAVEAHRVHRAAWYAAFVGPLLVPVSALNELLPYVTGDDVVGLIGDTGVAGLPTALQKVRTAGWTVSQLEVAVAKRGEDPQPGLQALRRIAAEAPDIAVYAEIPLTWGLLAALDTTAEDRTAGLRIAPKFRTGGLAAELFPTPVELAAVISACRDRELPFKLTAGLHHAMRHTDPETGFTHHGFLNVLVATAAAVEGAEVAEVAEVLGATHPMPLVEPVRSRRTAARPLWAGFGSCSVMDPLTDLIRFGLINGGFE
jgi:hypothetical protein